MPDRFQVLSSSSADEMRWAFAAEIRAGMGARPRSLSSMYFYDDEGSDLFQKIMRMAEYYPTDCELEIFTQHRDGLIGNMGDRPFNLVDLGAGDGTKTQVLLQRLVEMGSDVVYVPIDISEGAMQVLTQRIATALPALRMEGLVTDYVSGLRWLKENRAERMNTVLFLGSNLGNFDHAGTLRFLARLRSALRQDDRVVMGFDLKKDIHVIQRAYDDSEGITAAFNLNLLKRINREFNANFDLEKFGHHAYYNPNSGAAESYLISLARQTVTIGDLDLEIDFDEYEPIHTEYSHKYLRSDIQRYAHASGFVVDDVFEDTRGWFADAVWRVARPASVAPASQG